MKVFQNYIIKNRFFISTLMVALFPLFFQGCYTYRAGEVVSQNKLVGTEQLINFSYSVKLNKKPSIEQPLFSLQLEKTPNNKIKARQMLSKDKYENGMILLHTGLGGFFTIVGFGSWISGKTKMDRTLGPVLSIGGLVWLYGAWFLDWGLGENKGPTGQILPGKIVDDYEKGTPESDRGSNLSIQIGSIKKNYESNDRGLIDIDLVKDFNLHTFSYPQTIKLRAYSLEKKLNQSFSFQTKDWTIPYVRIKDNNVSVETERAGKLVVLGKANKGEEYKILHEGSELIKINYKGKEGYIPKSATTKFWSIQNRNDIINN